jgi:Predicted transcriptional regulator
MEKLILLPQEAAELLGVAEKTLRNWRSQHTGPKFVRLSRGLVGYRRESLIAWIEEAEIDPRPAKRGRPRKQQTPAGHAGV